MMTKTTFITSLKDRITRAILSWSGRQKGSETIVKSIASLTIPIGMLS